MKNLFSIICFVMLLMFVSAKSQADTLTDPEVLFINYGNGPIWGSEINAINTNTVNLLENGGGQPTLNNPVLLILGIPNTNTYNLPSVTLSSGTGVVGVNNAGTFNSGTVYGFLGLNGSPSESFTNWSAGDFAVNAITVAGFQVGYYDLTGTGLTGGSSVNITFGQDLPLGTYVVAFGCSGSTNLGTHKNPNNVLNTPANDCNGTLGDTFATPFTQSGLETGPPSVPEPSTLLLLGSGLIGLALWGRKRIVAS